MRFSPVIPCLCLISALAGCAPQPRMSSDLAACRRSADQSMGPGVSIDPSDEHNPSPMAMARREELRGQYQSLVDDCMGDNSPK